jgi:hypothetical protein
MSYEVLFLDDAEIDVDEAFIWYESKQIDLGLEFINEVDKAVLHISEHPKSYQKIYLNIRRFILGRFPYGIYYLIDDKYNLIKVIGVISFKRNPEIPKRRIMKDI